MTVPQSYRCTRWSRNLRVGQAKCAEVRGNLFIPVQVSMNIKFLQTINFVKHMHSNDFRNSSISTFK